MVAATQILAGPQSARQVKTTAELVELCRVSVDDPSSAAAMGFCLGYIDAALHYHAGLTSGARFDPIVCPHPAVSREEIVTLFLDWSRANPQRVDAGLAVEDVMRAVYEKWPCSGP